MVVAVVLVCYLYNSITIWYRPLYYSVFFALKFLLEGYFSFLSSFLYSELLVI